MNHGLDEVSDEQFAPLISNGAMKMIDDAFGGQGVQLSESDRKDVLGEFLEKYQKRIADETVLYDGCLDSLDTLASSGWLFAIATNKYERLAKLLIEKLGITDYFAVIAGGDTFDVRKPDAGHLLGILDIIGCASSSSIMVGDSLNDVLAAKNADIPSIAVRFGYTTVPVEELGATEVISHYREFCDAVTRIESGR